MKIDKALRTLDEYSADKVLDYGQSVGWDEFRLLTDALRPEQVRRVIRPIEEYLVEFGRLRKAGSRSYEQDTNYSDAVAELRAKLEGDAALDPEEANVIFGLIKSFAETIDFEE